MFLVIKDSIRAVYVRSMPLYRIVVCNAKRSPGLIRMGSAMRTPLGYLGVLDTLIWIHVSSVMKGSIWIRISALRCLSRYWDVKFTPRPCLVRSVRRSTT